MALFPLVLLLLVCSGATSDLDDVLTITRIELFMYNNFGSGALTMLVGAIVVMTSMLIIIAICRCFDNLVRCFTGPCRRPIFPPPAQLFSTLQEHRPAQDNIYCGIGVELPLISITDACVECLV
ncbi:uncharacterized protein LOC134821123 isoform X2 [Bolinopsis microptera]|uniref:uncharacterized protein LOC134821123 isoform X2 n=1 Tax=Bolinopsis microptera TaxID=2820187 RepID=UPI003079D3D5